MNEAKLNPLALGYASAIIAVAIMLLLGILGNLGIYSGAVVAMQQWHMFFDLSIVGVITGMIEAAVVSFIFMTGLAWIYNLFTK